MQYSYECVDSAGFVQRGKLEAASEQQAIELLFGRGLTPVELKLAPAVELSAVLKSKGRVRQSDVVSLIRELATLLTSGVALSEAFLTLLEATEHPGIADALTKLVAAVHAGEGFSDALRGVGLPLPEYVHALARAGEATGDIGTALARSADQLEFDERMRNEAKEALTYPIILIATGIAAIIFIFAFVVPRFAGLLKGRAVDLPILSKWVLGTGLYVNSHWIQVVCSIAGAVATALLLFNRPGFVARLNEAMARVPGLSSWLGRAETARWVSILAALITSRVAILTSLDLAASSVKLKSSFDRIQGARDEVRLGKQLSLAIEEQRLLEGSALSMLKVGEKSGELGTMLRYIATYTAERHRLAQRRLVSLIEPLSILVIGLVLGVIMVGVVLAMTSLTEVKL